MRRKPHSNRFKAMRHALRLLGIDPKECVYQRREVLSFKHGGHRQVVFKLNPSCGRAQYKKLKGRQHAS